MDSKSANGEIGSTVCAWCEKVLVVGNPEILLSHGICLSCMADQYSIPKETLESMSAEQLNQLPFGVVRITGEGDILSYNDSESSISSKQVSEVIGKNFFREVAPCTNVLEFYGEFLKLREKKVNGRAKIKFIFQFASGTMLVSVVMLYDALSGLGTILVKPLVHEDRTVI